MDAPPKTENPKPETVLSGREYLGLKSITGPLLVVTGVRGVGFDESVEVTPRMAPARPAGSWPWA